MHNGGFTLTELLVALAIATILIAVVVPFYGQYARRAYQSQAEADLLACAQGLERYAAEQSSYRGAEMALAAGTLCAARSVATGRYRLSVRMQDDHHYVLTATPVGTMAGSAVLSYDSRHPGPR